MLVFWNDGADSVGADSAGMFPIMLNATAPFGGVYFFDFIFGMCTNPAFFRRERAGKGWFVNIVVSEKYLCTEMQEYVHIPIFRSKDFYFNLSERRYSGCVMSSETFCVNN